MNYYTIMKLSLIIFYLKKRTGVAREKKCNNIGIAKDDGFSKELEETITKRKRRWLTKRSSM